MGWDKVRPRPQSVIRDLLETGHTVGGEWRRELVKPSVFTAAPHLMPPELHLRSDQQLVPVAEPYCDLRRDR